MISSQMIGKAMPKRRFWFAAAAVLMAGWLAGQATQAMMAAMRPAPDLCWHPGMTRNIGIAEQPCP
jgi:hypothetical protein